MELFLECQSRVPMTFRCIFAGCDHLWFFFHVFLEKDGLSFSVQGKGAKFSGKKPIFPDNTKKIMFGWNFLKRSNFQNTWRKYHISMYSFEKNHVSFSVEWVRSYFLEKGRRSFQIIEERWYSSDFIKKDFSINHNIIACYLYIWKKIPWISCSVWIVFKR